MIGALVATLLMPAFVCTRAGNDGPSLAWGPREIVIQRSGGSPDVNETQIDDAIARGAAQWTNAGGCTDVVVTVGPPTTDRLTGFDWKAGSGSPDNHNIVVFRNETPGDPLDAWLHSQGALAITTITFDANTGRLLDADVEVNDVGFHFTACDPQDEDCTVDFDLENTLTHELGHVLGLDHSSDGSATMFASASRQDLSKRDLSPDDITGICTIYPTNQPDGECYGVGRAEPSNVRFSPTVCGAGGAPALWALLVFARLTRTRRH